MGGFCKQSRWRHSVTVPSQDGGYVLLWQRYDNNKMADMCYYGNVILHLQQYSHRLNLFNFIYFTRKWSLIRSCCLCFAVSVWADLSLKLLTPLIISQSNKSNTRRDTITWKAHFAYRSSACKIFMVLFSRKPNVVLNVKTFCQVGRQAETVNNLRPMLRQEPAPFMAPTISFRPEYKWLQTHTGPSFNHVLARDIYHLSVNAPSKTVHVRCSGSWYGVTACKLHSAV